MLVAQSRHVLCTLEIAGVSEAENAVVQIDDPGTAEPAVSGALWRVGQGQSLSDGWISGINADANLSMSFSASDPGGICTLEAALTDASGHVVASSMAVQQTPVTDPGSAAAIANDLPDPFTTTQPCGGSDSGTSTFAPNLASLTTGTYYLNVASQNPGEYQADSFTYAVGDALDNGLAVKIDNSTPSVTVTPSNSNATTGGGSAADWSASPESLTVAASDVAGSSGLEQITCTTPDGTTSYPVSGDQASIALSVSTPGSDSVRCDATSVAGNTSTVSSTDFDVDAQVPVLHFSGAESAPGWNSGAQTVTATGSEAAQASGIASISCELDGGGWTTAPGSVERVGVTGDGSHELSCYTTTVAGIDSATTSESVQIDSDAPTLTLSSGPNQARWHRTGQTITAVASATGGDQISSITCTFADLALAYPNSEDTSKESVVIPVAAPGGELNCVARDTAGNVSTAKSWSFLIDSTPPTGYFDPRDSANPTLVAVSLADQGSGVARAQIQMDANGSWRSLPTTLNAATGRATAQIPDDGSLKDGAYALRARVWDKAGNSGYVTKNGSGATESVTLPLRELTDLSAALIADRARIAASAFKEMRHLAVRYGQRVKVAGQLVTAAGKPVAHAAIVISERVADSQKILTVAKTSTDGNGRFSSTLSPGPSRTLRISYGGSPLLRSASAAVAARVTGSVTLSVPSIFIAGRRVTLRGRVLGGYVPRTGLLIQLWYEAAGGQGGWEPFEHAVRANLAGDWSLSFPVSSAVAGRDYAFKAIVAVQGNWPYAGAASRSASLKVV